MPFRDVKFLDVGNNIVTYLKNVLNAINRPLWMNATTGAIRTVDTVTTVASITAVTTVASITAVTTVTSMTQVGGIAAYESMLIIPMRNNWANLIRPRIT